MWWNMYPTLVKSKFQHSDKQGQEFLDMMKIWLMLPVNNYKTAKHTPAYCFQKSQI